MPARVFYDKYIEQATPLLVTVVFINSKKKV